MYTTRRYFGLLPIHFCRWILYKSFEYTVNSSFAFLVQVERIAKILQRNRQKLIFPSDKAPKPPLSESSEFLLNEAVSKAATAKAAKIDGLTFSS